MLPLLSKAPNMIAKGLLTVYRNPRYVFLSFWRCLQLSVQNCPAMNRVDYNSRLSYHRNSEPWHSWPVIFPPLWATHLQHWQQQQPPSQHTCPILADWISTASSCLRYVPTPTTAAQQHLSHQPPPAMPPLSADVPTPLTFGCTSTNSSCNPTVLSA
jgi:hypothetical protein